MTASPEFLALLEQLRQERDAANDATARTSDQHRAQWLARTEADIASQRTPEAEAPAYGDALLAAVEEETRHVVDRRPWAQTVMGTVRSVDRATETCRVRIASDALAPGGVPSTRRVSYSVDPPTVGRTYPVHFPHVLPRAPQSLTGGPQPDPEHLPWLKATGGARWLYWKNQASAQLIRYGWPPPSDSAGWLVEVVHRDVPEAWVLFGSATPTAQSTQIVFKSMDLIDHVLQESAFFDFIQFREHYHHYPEMGFGAVGLEWTPNPDWVIGRAIANDGTTTGGNAEFGDTIHFEGGYQWPVTETDTGVFPHRVCTLTLDPDFVPPTFSPPTKLGGRAWRGTLGSFAPVQAVTNAWTVDYYSGGTDMIDNCGTFHAAFSPWLVARWHYLGDVVEGQDGLPCWGAWEYDGLPAAGYAWYASTWAQTGTAGPDTAIPGEALYGETLPVIRAYGSGCQPGGPITLPMIGDPVADGLPNLLTGALDADRHLELWAAMFDPDPRLVRWTAANPGVWQAIAPCITLQAVSRDGTDVLGFDAAGHQIYSLDSGTTWQACPPLPEGAGTLPPGDWFTGASAEDVPLYSNLIFVDEVA